MDSSCKLLLPRAKRKPPVVEVKPVHPKYDKLRGHHADHPGTGKGPGALARNSATTGP